MAEDPSLIDTYTFASEITKDPRRSLQFAQKAAQYNPDYPYAWQLVGRAAGPEESAMEVLARFGFTKFHKVDDVEAAIEHIRPPIERRRAHQVTRERRAALDKLLNVRIPRCNDAAEEIP